VEGALEKEGIEVLGWRQVPVDESVLGHIAKKTLPKVEQVFVKVSSEQVGDDSERELFITRKLIEKAKEKEPWSEDLYFCSFSSRTIVYKGMMRSTVVGMFYDDLHNESYVTPFAIYHRRFSTNTSPRWPLAQPMRFLGHNGEINTIQVYFSSPPTLWLAFSECSTHLILQHSRGGPIIFVQYVCY
jgi:glutamate synthase (ferredoxin)